MSLTPILGRASVATKFLNQVIFGRRNLLLTNALISAAMATVGDSVVQSYECLSKTSSTKGPEDGPKDEESAKGYQLKRTMHMTTAGLTTGVTTHYWYLALERMLGSRRTASVLLRKIALDQILFSPVNLFVYFGTLGFCERSTWTTIWGELLEKGLKDIYLAEWVIWPPVQLINFALLPLRYRILFDNVVSLGFDIYSPYVKYEKK